LRISLKRRPAEEYVPNVLWLNGKSDRFPQLMDLITAGFRWYNHMTRTKDKQHQLRTMEKVYVER
jgi:hypothetical protein